MTLGGYVNHSALSCLAVDVAEAGLDRGPAQLRRDRDPEAPPQRWAGDGEGPDEFSDGTAKLFKQAGGEELANGFDTSSVTDCCQVVDPLRGLLAEGVRPGRLRRDIVGRRLDPSLTVGPEGDVIERPGDDVESADGPCRSNLGRHCRSGRSRR